MQRLVRAVVFGALIAALVSPAAAQVNVGDRVPVSVTRGDLALSLVKIAEPAAAREMTAQEALRRVQETSLMPRHWRSDDLLTRDDISSVAWRLGFELRVDEPALSVTRSELDAFTLRELGERRDMVASALGVGRLPVDGIFDEPPDRYISASEF